MSPTHCDTNTKAKLTTQCNALLNSEISDKVVFPNNKAYETSVHSYWAVNVQLQPNCIVQPLSANDVSVAVRTLSNSIPGESCKFAVRSGGHTTWAGANNIKDGVTIDLSQMNSTHYTKGAKTATIHPGARWASVYKDLEPYGVTVPGGRTGPVGVGGFLIGGGNTFHTARVGFACDNVENFEVVLASGEVVNANRHTNTDLYKALKGGTINFGIVTKYELRIIPQDTLWGGMVMYDNSTSPQQVRAINRFIDNIHNDPYASYIGMWQYSSKLDKNGITTPLEYTKPEAFPAAYNDFYQIKNISSTMRFDNMYNLTQELGQPDGFRYVSSLSPKLLSKNIPADKCSDVFLTGTYENNVKVLSKVIDIHNHKIEEIKAQAKSKSWTLATMIQPWAKIFWEHSAERGGNMLGLDRFDRNLFRTSPSQAHSLVERDQG